MEEKPNSLAFAERRRAYPDMFLEEFAQKTLIGEVQILRNLLNTLVRVLQQQAQFQHHIVVNPLVWSALTDGFDGFGEIFWRNTKLCGIPTDAPFLLEMVAHEADIVEKDHFSTRKALGFYHLIAIDHVAHVIDKRLHERADQLATEVMLGLHDLRYHRIEIARKHFDLPFSQREDRMKPRKEEKRVQIADTRDDIVEEIVGKHDGNTVAIVRRKEVFDQLSLSNDDHIAWIDAKSLRIHGVTGLSPSAERKEKALHPARLPRHGHLIEMLIDQEILIDEVTFGIELARLCDTYLYKIASFHIYSPSSLWREDGGLAAD